MSSLLFALLVPGPPGTRQAAVRDRAADVIAVLSALAYGAVMVPLGDATSPHAAVPWPVDVAIGVACTLALVVRRRHPLGLCLVLLPFGVVSVMASGAILVALFTVAIRFRWRPVLGLAALHIGTGVVYYALQSDPPFDLWVDLVLRAVTGLAAVGWGMFLQAYRHLMSSLRSEADNARAQAQLRMEQARLTERTRIAREMHDVLAHRMSMVSLHAGALEVRGDASPDEIATAARAIRVSSHEALEELRSVIGVLRRHGDEPRDSPPAGNPAAHTATRADHRAVRAEPPQPRFSDLPDLLTEARSSGMNIDFAWVVPRAVPSQELERTVYRVVQEALTNAGKHAPGSDVEVLLDGGGGVDLRILVTNSLGEANGRRGDPVPGSGNGLIGVGERVALAGGRVEFGPEHGRFRLEAWLPWHE
ncbi:sensor histidine kinase [Actinoplanes bogorensis]|uniref:histidine kinase n=1 Tax=Paractinoplanes bogorensis TaxID=1610840 RepID=A0ABS5YRF3_9ACTN|nr:histidine kinase [Actinoplanes bogorensis]MBU2666028.1 sensor histidine kinase [Actinoplanes bogorensis]